MYSTMESENAVRGGGCGREMTLYVCRGGLLEEGPGGKSCYEGGGKTVCG